MKNVLYLIFLMNVFWAMDNNFMLKDSEEIKIKHDGVVLPNGMQYIFFKKKVRVVKTNKMIIYYIEDVCEKEQNKGWQNYDINKYLEYCRLDLNSVSNNMYFPLQVEEVDGGVVYMITYLHPIQSSDGYGKIYDIMMHMNQIYFLGCDYNLSQEISNKPSGLVCIKQVYTEEKLKKFKEMYELAQLKKMHANQLKHDLEKKAYALKKCKEEEEYQLKQCMEKIEPEIERLEKNAQCIEEYLNSENKDVPPNALMELTNTIKCEYKKNEGVSQWIIANSKNCEKKIIEKKIIEKNNGRVFAMPYDDSCIVTEVNNKIYENDDELKVSLKKEEHIFSITVAESPSEFLTSDYSVIYNGFGQFREGFLRKTCKYIYYIDKNGSYEGKILSTVLRFLHEEVMRSCKFFAQGSYVEYFSEFRILFDIIMQIPLFKNIIINKDSLPIVFQNAFNDRDLRLFKYLKGYYLPDENYESYYNLFYQKRSKYQPFTITSGGTKNDYNDTFADLTCYYNYFRLEFLKKKSKKMIDLINYLKKKIDNNSQIHKSFSDLMNNVEKNYYQEVLLFLHYIAKFCTERAGFYKFNNMYEIQAKIKPSLFIDYIKKNIFPLVQRIIINLNNDKLNNKQKEQIMRHFIDNEKPEHIAAIKAIRNP